MRLSGLCLLLAALCLPSQSWAQRSGRAESVPDEAAAAELARGELAQARLDFERGEWAAAVLRYEAVLESTPRAVRTAEGLHEGFLYYAFTLFLQQDEAGARSKLTIALQIDPGFAPSPVTTRPDLLDFYNSEQDRFRAQNGSTPVPLEAIFPDLATRPGRRYQRQVFLPVWGRGLHQLGHRREGAAFAIFESTTLALNVGSLLAKAALQRVANSDTVEKTVKPTLSWLTLHTAIGFWASLSVDVITSFALQRRYRLNPGLVPGPQTPIAPAPPVLLPTPGGLILVGEF